MPKLIDIKFSDNLEKLKKEMKFGKELTIHLNETLPDWKDKYLCYKPLKKLLKTYSTSSASVPAVDVNGDPLEAWFLRILNDELEKFNDFYVDKEEEFVIRFQVGAFCISLCVID